MESSLQFCYCSLGRTQHTLKGHSGPVSRQREVQETGQAHFLWFPQEEKGEAEQAGLGLANVSNFADSGTKGRPPVVWYLALRQWGGCTVACNVRTQ